MCDNQDRDTEDIERHDEQLHDGGENALRISNTLSKVMSDAPLHADFLLDVNTADYGLLISDDRKTASWSCEHQSYPETAERFQGFPQVMSNQNFSSGRHYWKVDVGESKSWRVGLCYPSIDRSGYQSWIGNNNKSWCLKRELENCYSMVHDKNVIHLLDKILIKRIGIYLDYEGGQISFYTLCDVIRPLHTFIATFSEPLHAALCVGRGCIKICGGETNDWHVSQSLESPVYADILLNVNTAGNYGQISDDGETLSRSSRSQYRFVTPEGFQYYPRVLSSRSFSSGRHYWEVDVGEFYFWAVGMCYPSIDGRGLQSRIGYNNKSWFLYKWCNQYSVIHDSKVIQLRDKIPSDRVRIYLDYEAGQISFYAPCDPIRHLHTFTATFSKPLHGALLLSMCDESIWKWTNPKIGTEHQISEFPHPLHIEIDVHTAGNHLKISDDGKMVCWTFDDNYHPEMRIPSTDYQLALTRKRFNFYPQALSRGWISSGRHYWEVDVRKSSAWRVGMCYPSIERIGLPQSLIGNNNKSWCLAVDGDQYSAKHDGNRICLPTNIYISTVRIDLDYEAGEISFYALCDPIRPLHTFTATFTEPLHAALCVWEGCIAVLS